MKKTLTLLAAAAMMFGLASCTDENVLPEVINDIDVEGGAAPTALVKTTSDLIGTDWQYTMEDFVIVDDMGDTLAVIPMSDLVFGLNFDNDYAHISFPEDIVVLTVGEDADGMPTMEQLESLNYEYAYDGTTKTGDLTATYIDENGDEQPALIPFTYDETTDAIIIEFGMEDMEGNETTAQIVFHRN